MPYPIPDFGTIRQRMLRDAANLDPTAPQDRDSDLFVRSSATASAVSVLYHFLAWQARQLLPDTADPEYLEQHCALRGITRKPATRATGTLTLTGRTGAVVPAGTQAKDLSGVLYRTTVSVTLAGTGDDATATAPCEAVEPGALPDMESAGVTLLAAPSGVRSTARLDLTGGTDMEADAELLARLLEYMRDPPAGGTTADYRRWAKEVSGVSEAIVYPLRQGPGTVDIVIIGPDGIPGDDVRQAAQAHIDACRPVTAKASTVYVPEALVVDFSWRIKTNGTVTLLELQPQIEELLALELNTLLPGESVILSRLQAMISNLRGVVDVTIVSPVANITPTDLEWARLGTVTLGVL